MESDDTEMDVDVDADDAEDAESEDVSTIIQDDDDEEDDEGEEGEEDGDEETIDDDEVDDGGENADEEEEEEEEEESEDDLSSSPGEQFAVRMETCLFGRLEMDLPIDLIQQKDLFNEVFSLDTWQHHLTDEHRQHLLKFLPSFPKERDQVEKQITLRKLFGGLNFKFGNPLQKFYTDLKGGRYSPDISKYTTLFRKAKYREYIYQQQKYYTKLLKDILISRQRVLESVGSLTPGGQLKPLPKAPVPPKEKSINYRVKMLYQKVLKEVQEECGVETSDEEDDFNVPGMHSRHQFASPRHDKESWTPSVQSTLASRPGNGIDDGSFGPVDIDDDDFRDMITQHRRRRMTNDDSADLDTRGLNLQDIIIRTQPNANKRMLKLQEMVAAAEAASAMPANLFAPPPAKKSKLLEKKKRKLKLKIPKQETAVKDEYAFDKSDMSDFSRIAHSTPSKRNFGMYVSFFSLLKEFICENTDQKISTSRLEEKVLEWQASPSCSLCPWLNLEPNWVELVPSGLKFLSGDVLGLSIENFIPLVDYKERAQLWKWIGAGRDSDEMLQMLCNHWLQHRKEGLSEMGEHADSPPPARSRTSYIVHRSSAEEKAIFRQQEEIRFNNPHRAFTYKMHGYQSTVGPVKGVYNKDSTMNKAREHNLLINERPPYVTILTLVRDAAARLPNGEGTRADICELLKDSHFLAPGITDAQINTVVSGALDRLHYEKDPCVKYDVNRKLWIYLHRHRTEEEFEKIHEAQGAAAKAKRALQKPKSTKKAKEAAAAANLSANASTGASSLESLNLNLSDGSTSLGQTMSPRGTSVSPRGTTASPRIMQVTPGMVMQHMSSPGYSQIQSSPKQAAAGQHSASPRLVQTGVNQIPANQQIPASPVNTPTTVTFVQPASIGQSDPNPRQMSGKPYAYSVVQSPQGTSQSGQTSPLMQGQGQTILVSGKPGSSPQTIQTSPRVSSTASPKPGQTGSVQARPTSASPKPSGSPPSGASSPLIARIVQGGAGGTQIMSVGNLIASTMAAVQKQGGSLQGTTTIKIQGTNIVAQQQLTGKPAQMVKQMGGKPSSMGGKPMAISQTGGKPMAISQTGGKPMAISQTGGKPMTISQTSGKPMNISQIGGKPASMSGKPLTVQQVGGKPHTVVTGKPGSIMMTSKPSTTVIGGKPAQIIYTGGKPLSMGGKPVTMGGKPVSMAAKPVAMGGKPVSVVGGKPVSMGKPFAMAGGKPVTIGGKPFTVGGKPVTMVTQIDGKQVAITTSTVASSGATVSGKGNVVVTSGKPASLLGKTVQVGGKPVHIVSQAGSPGSPVIRQQLSGKPAAMVSSSGAATVSQILSGSKPSGSPRTASPQLSQSQAGLILAQLAQSTANSGAQAKQGSSPVPGTQLIMPSGQGQATRVQQVITSQGTGGKPQNIQVLRTVLGQSTGKPGQTTYVITQAGLEQSPEGNQGTGEQKTKTGKQNKPGTPVFARIITPPPGVRLTPVSQDQATPTGQNQGQTQGGGDS